MSTTAQEPKDAQQDQSKPQDQQGQQPEVDGDKPLGPNGEKALKSEREARQAVEQQFTQFKNDQQAKWEQLAEALGVKKDAKSDTTDVVTELQKQMAGLQHNNLVLTVAGENQITDKDDLDLLRTATNEDTMRKLAARLAAKAPEGGGDRGDQRRSPRPDPSQGRGSDGGAKPSSVAQVMADRRAAREAAKK